MTAVPSPPPQDRFLRKARNLATRLLPKSLAGQTILLVLLAIFIAQGVTLWVISDDNRVMEQALRREVLLDRAAAATRTTIATPDPAVRQDLLAALSDRRLHFSLSDQPLPGLSGQRMSDFDLRTAEQIASTLSDSGVQKVLAHGEELKHFWRKKWFDFERNQAGKHAREKDDDDDDHHEMSDDMEDLVKKHMRYKELSRKFKLALSIQLPDSQWLNISSKLTVPPRPRALPILFFFLIVTVILSAIIILMIRRITRPMAKLSQAAEALGRGQTPPLLDAESGPEELRRTTQAFNDMQARLQRFVQDRTAMLAAMSHDLRTPITTLRLRAEFIEDEETKTKILETLAEMQQMVEASLDFLREESKREDSQKLDLNALLQALVDDLSDLKHDITFKAGGSSLVTCQPMALKRALRNLMSNACFYGQKATVLLQQSDGHHQIIIEDEGPGIPEDQLEEVFRPFFRLDASRNRDTGGIGLGLAIARTIARAQGGDLVLENRLEGGLRATLTLPEGSQD